MTASVSSLTTEVTAREEDGRAASAKLGKLVADVLSVILGDGLLVVACCGVSARKDEMLARGLTVAGRERLRDVVLVEDVLEPVPSNMNEPL